MVTEEKYFGFCPACGEPVRVDEDVVWTEREQLSEGNVYAKVTYTVGFGGDGLLPLHGECYNSGTW